jgi:hypothetical protein
MIRIGEGVFCQNIGELKKAIADIPDDTRFAMMKDEGGYLVEIWKLRKSTDGITYEYEKECADEENRKPNFRRVTIQEEDR